MTWILVNLNRHPEALAKLRVEIKENLPGLLTGEIEIPTMDDLQNLPYLEAVVKENLRLYGIATARVPNQSVTLSDGTFAPFGCAVIMPANATARLKSKVTTVSPFKFSTFISGPRQCIGMGFALMKMRIATAVLFSRFDLKTVQEPFDIS
ncbi:hypothetical protein PRNP1_002827 [Phytophthora ramorum]